MKIIQKKISKINKKELKFLRKIFWKRHHCDTPMLYIIICSNFYLVQKVEWENHNKRYTSVAFEANLVIKTKYFKDELV